MDSYLSIECVIEQMVLLEMIRQPSAWKRTMTGTKAYPVDLWHAKNNSLITFHVSTIGGRRCVRVNSLVRQVKYFGWSVGGIASQCAV
ncbi:MAG: hypothetical protein LBL45_05335 [Treponema sp.]|nr:hypothetical protein [Treponema sp.]